MGSEKIVLLFSGYNDRAVVAFARTLRANSVRFAIIARDNSDHIFDSDYADRVVSTRTSSALDRHMVSGLLEKVRMIHGEVDCLVAPSTEALNRFLLRERSFLEAQGITVPLVNEGLYAAISDKSSFAEICRNFGISVPSEYRSLDDIDYPFVAKPKNFRSLTGVIHSPLIVYDRLAKERFRKECDEGDFFFQEYVQGNSIYLLYHFGRDGSVVKLSQENLVQQPGGKSIVAATTSHFHEGAESARYEAMFESLNFRGLVMVEVRQSGSNVYMIEANPRFWGPSQLFVDAGVNLFEEFLYDHNVIEERSDCADQKEARYFWYGGFQAAKQGADRPVYYRGTEDEFLSELEQWISIDVYRRGDTMKIFCGKTT
jgi:predicted ATP-grasp superfamily ATP-dependent carboligase